MSAQQELNIECSQYLDVNGTLVKHLPKFIDKYELLIDLYRTLVLTRLFDETAVNLQRVGVIGTYAQSKGQEAIGTAIGHAMLADDVFIPYYRDVAAQIQRGVLLEEILQYWGGDERGSHYVQQVNDFPLCVPIATQLCHAIGVAYALKYQSKPNVAVVTCGDGATSKGDFYESLNIAGVMSLPTLFIVNNNQWAISVPLERQTASKTIAHKALAAGISAVRVDGNDVLAMLINVNSALDQIRQTGKPFFIEAISYRICDHTTADDALRYMDKKLLEDANKKEPLIRYKRFLTEQHAWTDKQDQALYQQCQQQVDTAVEAYKNLPAQSLGEFFDYMYEQLPSNLATQKQEFLNGLKHHE
ncbi:MAG: pyruvate dehydrogenase (acetyl-transferring) E1 component subunit alpha [Piscirickettsiaceae bacterium]|nr:MAG: pyruvate dehydrogenase (acetyl-transferring) E1 component subunit alpha [Piscirickettsiaceae bacterium]